jgi:hypothetical protein
VGAGCAFRQRFFFEKKKQKTFIHSRGWIDDLRMRGATLRMNACGARKLFSAAGAGLPLVNG